MSLALKGQRFALFKTQRVLSCNSNYFGYKHRAWGNWATNKGNERHGRHVLERIRERFPAP
ncbi:hypothetical protein CWD78_16505 [Dickeya dadantii]|nr:hypothetical protein [Dickeya dadantii]